MEKDTIACLSEQLCRKIPLGEIKENCFLVEVLGKTESLGNFNTRHLPGKQEGRSLSLISGLPCINQLREMDF